MTGKEMMTEMNLRTNNHAILDLGKVAYANFYYTTVKGYTTRLKPAKPTVHGCAFDPEAKVFGMGESKGGITMMDYALLNDLLDRWIPTVRFQLSNSHVIVYTGEKAVSMYEAWKSRIFKKEKKK